MICKEFDTVLVGSGPQQYCITKQTQGEEDAFHSQRLQVVTTQNTVSPKNN
jgi:hypothetical protein